MTKIFLTASHMKLSCRYSLFAIRYSLFAIRYSLFAIRYPLSAIRYSLFAIRYPLFAIRYPLSAIRYPLSAALPLLACRAKKSAASGHDQAFYGSPTNRTGLPGPAVDLELNGKEAGFPFTIGKVGDGCPPGPNGPAQDAANGFEEDLPHLERYFPCRGLRVYARFE